MPEGHTLHRLARDHHAWFAGGKVAVTSPQGRFAGAGRVDGRRVAGVAAHGKHLLYDMGAGDLIHVHLGLFGRFTHHSPPAPDPRETVRMRLRSAQHVVDLVGATTCELITPDQRDELVGRLGPDPIVQPEDPGAGWAALQRKRVGIGRALLDQSVLAGVGNVYRAEVLFVHGLHPEVPAVEVQRDRWDALWSTLHRWMAAAVDSRRIVTVPPEERGDGAVDGPGRTRYVYKQDRCLRCDGPIRRWDLAGRWAYACETCQPPPS